MRRLTPDEHTILQRLYLAYPAPLTSVELARQVSEQLGKDPKVLRKVVKALIVEGYAEMVRDVGRSYDVQITLTGVEYLRHFANVHWWGEMPGRSPWKVGFKGTKPT